MEILNEKDGVDTELLVYTMSLINKVHIHTNPHILTQTHSLPHILTHILTHTFTHSPSHTLSVCRF